MRSWKYGLNEGFSWSTGIAYKQDITVSIQIAEEVGPYSNMYDGLPVDVFVDGRPIKISEGSGDHRVIIKSMLGWGISVFFPTTGIYSDVWIRVGASMHIRDIPGSLNAGLCLPMDNKNIKNVMGLMGTPDGNGENEWMDTNGNTITKWSIDQYDYSTDNWCVRDQSKSLFNFDRGQPFSHYNRCDAGQWDRMLETAVEPSDEVKAICSQVQNNTACLYDGANGGSAAAEAAVDAIKTINKANVAAKRAELQDDAACCSRDFKTCDEACGKDKYTCGSCDPTDTFKWLAHGPYDDADAEYGCLAKAATCGAGDSCCPGLECNGGACVPKATTDASRRLKEFVFKRPDLPAVRNIVPYSHPEL